LDLFGEGLGVHSVEVLGRVDTGGGEFLGDTRALFDDGNAVSELLGTGPTYIPYPASHLRGLFETAGWGHTETTTLLDPVSWTAELLDAHAEIASDRAGSLPDLLTSVLRTHIECVQAGTGERGDTEWTYSVRLELPA